MRILIFAAALAAFAATCRTGEFARPETPARAGTTAPVPARTLVPAPGPATPERASLPTADLRGLPDTIGVLIERRFAKPAAQPSVDDYLLYLPPGLERGDRPWPVILYLHGRSLRGDDLSLLLKYGLPHYLADGRTLPFIVVAPQLPDGESWTDVDRLAALLEDVLARYPADRDRVYLTGYSMGGGGVWRMALAYANLFAAAVPIAAWTPEPSEAWARALARLPMLVFHGTADEATPFAPAETMVAALRRSGADVELRAFEGADHGDLTHLYAQPELYDWFLAHRRHLD